MRKTIIALLLTATLATPVLARHEDRGDRGAARAERQQARAERQQMRAAPQAVGVQTPRADYRGRPDRGGDRGQRFQAQQAQQAQQQSQAQMTRDELARQPGRWRPEGYRTRAQIEAGDPQRPAFQQGQRDDRRNDRGDRRDWRGDRGNDRQDWRSDRGDNGRDWRNNRGDNGRDWRNNRGNDRQAYRDNGRRWNREWRNDRRYDWQRYRNTKRSYYHLPRYYAPRNWGYGYRRFGLGVYLDYSLYSQNYWINDPWSYRLPPAEYGYQWVRYYNDVMLIDVDSGYVVDVIYDFFL